MNNTRGRIFAPHRFAAILLAWGATLPLSIQAYAVDVNTLATPPVQPDLTWYASPITGSTPGTATIVNLTGAGGNLEFSQPAGVGAARLTTGADNNDRAGATLQGNFGNASLVLNDIDLEYWYHKVFVPGGSLATAPSIKLTLFNPTGTGAGNDDSFGQLIWEPANQGSNPPLDLWQQVVIDENSGSGSTASGGWWWSGGFGFANSGAGSPFRSLAEWDTAFSTGTDSADWAGAFVTEVQFGIGSYNPSTDVYFDDVLVKINNPSVLFNQTYNFEPILPPPPAPEPSTSVLAMFGAFGLAFGRRK